MKNCLPYIVVNNGDSAITIQFSESISEQLTRKIVAIEKQLQFVFEKKLQEVILGYQSITLIFDPLKTNINFITDRLTEILNQPITTSNYQPNLIQVPVCYDQEFAPDLPKLAKYCHLSEQEVIEKHTNTTYLVHMLGFLPGFLYLGGLHPQLYCPRKKTPSIRVVAGSIAIGGQQTGIYPVASPGGWHVIGRTPLTMFNPTKKYPAIASPLDQIEFISISYSEFIKQSSKNTLKLL